MKFLKISENFTPRGGGGPPPPKWAKFDPSGGTHTCVFPTFGVHLRVKMAVIAQIWLTIYFLKRKRFCIRPQHKRKGELTCDFILLEPGLQTCLGLGGVQSAPFFFAITFVD